MEGRTDSYVALIDGAHGAYGVAFPDCPGCTAMGKTVDEALAQAGAALAEWIADELSAGRGLPAPHTIEALRDDPDIAAALATGGILTIISDISPLPHSGMPRRGASTP
jgi:predicted RNase H-like HicB family nuclease